MDKYSTWEEAIAVAFFVIGTHIDINVKECTQCDGAGIVSHMIYNGQETTYICDMCNGSGVE
jgi:DnaJ-class molecular chaperone